MSIASLPLIADRPGPKKTTVDVEALRTALAAALAGEVRCERLSRALYSTDASVYQIVPLGVVLPKTADDVVNVVKICARFGVPITARGGGTSQAGQSIGAGGTPQFSQVLHPLSASQSGAR